MVRKFLLFCVVSFSLVACVNVGEVGDDDDDDSVSSPTPTATAGDANPVTGIWHYDEYTEVVNDCNYSDPIPGQDSGDFGLVNHEDGTFTVYPADNTDEFDCSLDKSDYECPSRAAATVDLSSQGVNAVLDITASVDGEFADDETAIGEQYADIDCAGADCSAVEAQLMISFPCEIRVDFTASWQSAL